MCGYIRRHIGTKELRKFVDLLDMPELFNHYEEEALTQHFYPAFGGASNRRIKDLIIRDASIKTVDATWWFDCTETNDQLMVGERTTFNARNLTSPYWKAAIRHHRGIVVCTGLGEGKVVEGKKCQYLMEGQHPLLLGAVYRPFSNGLYSTAIITRDEHPRFSRYHDKAFPLFLPPDAEFLKRWLSDEPASHPVIADLLAHPRVFTPLKVTPVKTFKDAVSIGESALLEADAW
jgi:putative SOS response-associated peptidase YedK